MLILALMAAQAAVPAPGPFKTFGDWAVACDNTRVCEMTTLAPEGGGESEGDMSITREPGPQGGFTVQIHVGPDARGTMNVEIDGEMVASGTPERDTLRFASAAADGIVRAMVNGRSMQVTAGAKPLARISLAGTAASLRMIDAEQGRAGTMSAVVAVGAKPARSVAAAPPVPVVRVVAAPGRAAKASDAQIATLAKRAGCDELYYGENQRPDEESFPLGGGKTLVLVPCGAGAYNFLTVPFVLAGGKAEVARFDHPTGMGEKGGPTQLVNASFDPAQGRIESHAKGRGLGDCGSHDSFGWDGAVFRLIEARVMHECRGSVNWLRIWRADAVVAR